MDWSPYYVRHFDQFFREPSECLFFQGPSGQTDLEVRSYDGVFQNCRTFATIGAANMSESLRGVGEVFTAAESGWDWIPRILAQAIFYMSHMKISLGWGVSIDGIDRLDPMFANSFSKSAVYFTLPVDMPGSFTQITCPEGTGLVYMAMFISQREHDYFVKYGSEKFENLMDSVTVDPFDLTRTSCV